MQIRPQISPKLRQAADAAGLRQVPQELDIIRKGQRWLRCSGLNNPTMQK
jgi:hypothetical protein